MPESLATLTRGNLAGLIIGFKGYLDAMCVTYPNIKRLKEARDEFDKRLSAMSVH